MSLNPVAHGRNSNSGMWSLFFATLSFFVSLLHLTLTDLAHMRLSCPLTLQREDRRQETSGLLLLLLLLTTQCTGKKNEEKKKKKERKKKETTGVASLKLISPIRPVTRGTPEEEEKKKKTQLQSMGILWGSAKSTYCFNIT